MKKLVVGFMLAAATLPVFAEENKVGVELMLGKAYQEMSVAGFQATKDNDLSLGFRGSYSVNQNLAVEAAYQMYGELGDTYVDSYGDTIRDTIETDAINLGVKGILPLDGGFSLSGRVGLSLWDLELKETDSSMPGAVFSAQDDGSDLYVGVGANYNLTKQFNLGVEYNIVNMDASIVGVAVEHRVKNFALTAGYSF